MGGGTGRKVLAGALAALLGAAAAVAAPCLNLFCTAGASRSGAEYSVGAAPRMQFQVGSDGYCGVMSIQVSMLKHGVWLPQEYVRVAATGDRRGAVLVETDSYPRIMRKLKIDAEQYGGGDEYREYMAFVKRGAVQGHIPIIVTQFAGSGFVDYGHIVPVDGITTATPGGGYDPDDTLAVHTHFTEALATRRVGSYRCGGSGRWPALERGGCVPRRGLGDGWAWVVRGPKYLGIGPRVELVGVPNQPRPHKHVQLPATVVVYGLTPGRSYSLHRITAAAKVPASKTGAVQGGAWKTFVAGAAQATFRTKVWSDKPAWFIARET